jgi:hypothetical protein
MTLCVSRAYVLPESLPELFRSRHVGPGTRQGSHREGPLVGDLLPDQVREPAALGDTRRLGGLLHTSLNVSIKVESYLSHREDLHI